MLQSSLTRRSPIPNPRTAPARLWLEPPETAVSPEILDRVGGNLLAAQSLCRRGFGDPQAARAFLDPDEYTPSPAEEFPGMERAVERLQAALQQGEHILVWGDFDVDGQTSTALLVAALRELGRGGSAIISRCGRRNCTASASQFCSSSWRRPTTRPAWC